MRTVPTLVLAVLGLASAAMSWDACGVVLLDERLSAALVLKFFGGLIAGGGLLAAAVARTFRSRGADGEMNLAYGLDVAGITAALGGGVVMAGAPFYGYAAEMGLAVFLLGVALTIGALMLLAWVANGPHWNR